MLDAGLLPAEVPDVNHLGNIVRLVGDRVDGRATLVQAELTGFGVRVGLQEVRDVRVADQLRERLLVIVAQLAECLEGSGLGAGAALPSGIRRR